MSRPVAEPNRVLATVLFTDIVGSTERAAELGDRAGATSWSAITPSSAASWTASGVARSTPPGDGFLATFDGPARAVRCARAIRDGVRASGLAGPGRAAHRRV